MAWDITVWKYNTCSKLRRELNVLFIINSLERATRHIHQTHISQQSNSVLVPKKTKKPTDSTPCHAGHDGGQKKREEKTTLFCAPGTLLSVTSPAASHIASGQLPVVFRAGWRNWASKHHHYWLACSSMQSCAYCTEYSVLYTFPSRTLSLAATMTVLYRQQTRPAAPPLSHGERKVKRKRRQMIVGSRAQTSQQQRRRRKAKEDDD